MKILSVNAGSSSLKFTLFLMPEKEELISGLFERIGEGTSSAVIKINGEKIKKELVIADHKAAFELLVEELIANKIVADLSEIEAIGHRLVHGGTHFNASVIATDANIKIVEDLSSLAPLHNPPAIIALKSAMAVFAGAVQTLVFDTAFHQTLAESEYLYPVPYEWYTDYGVRKYGFHGTSHKYVSGRANEILGKENTKVIVCHLGNGASISAVKDGKCIDTSMGLTPNSGLMMGTRCGDIDMTILPFMVSKANMTLTEIDNILNKKSGTLGVSGISNDSRDIEDGVARGDARCILARDMFVNRVVDYIAKYYVALGGCDLLAFTAGIGENSMDSRQMIVEKLACLGIFVDKEANNVRGEETLISTPESKTLVYIIPTNEELMIASDTYDLAVTRS